MYRFLSCTLVGAVGWAACAPSQRAVFAPVERQIEERTGVSASGRGALSDPALRQRISELARGQLSADDALRLALLANQDLQAAFAELGVARGAVALALTPENPELEAELRFARDGGTALELAVMQDIMSLFTLARRHGAAQARLEQARQRALAAAVDLVAEVRRAYYRALAAQQIHEMWRVILQSAEASYELSRQLHELGSITDLSLAQDRALYEQTRLELADAEVAAVAAREQLNAILGLWGPDAAAWTLPERLPELPEQPVMLDDLEGQAVARSIDLEELRWQMRAAHGEAGVYRLQRWLPELGVGALAEREHDGEWAVGPAVAVSVPIFDRKRGAILSSEAELRGAELRYRARAVAVRAAARTARTRLEHARRRVEHIRDVLLPLRQRILDQAILQYNAMNLSLFNLLQVKREQIETGRMYVEALRDYWLARTTIDQIQAGRAAAADAPGGPAPTASPGPARDAH